MNDTTSDQGTKYKLTLKRSDTLEGITKKDRFEDPFPP